MTSLLAGATAFSMQLAKSDLPDNVRTEFLHHWYKKVTVKQQIKLLIMGRESNSSGFCTFAQVNEWLQHPPAESSHWVLHARAQTEHALQVGFFQQQLPVGCKLACSTH